MLTWVKIIHFAQWNTLRCNYDAQAEWMEALVSWGPRLHHVNDKVGRTICIYTQTYRVIIQFVQNLLHLVNAIRDKL